MLMIILVKTKDSSYNIYLERGILSKVNEIIKLKGKALIVTDSGVPSEYPEKVSSLLGGQPVFVFKEGEGSKNLETFKAICERLLDEGFSRKDAVIAVGGGVTGDMAGFAAACYMRGIDFYNIPTTLLSQVDSSVGGKTAVDFCGVKNIIGAFYPPKAVVIDPDVLSTLPGRHISNGLAECIKTGVIGDESLFELCCGGEFESNAETIIEKSLLFKKKIVEEDEKESGVRKALNFGHTIGHGIESSVPLGELLHGECVALGMLPMCSDDIRSSVEKALRNCGLETKAEFDRDKAFNAILHDKKASGKTVTLVKSEKIGSFFFEETGLDELKGYIDRI